MIFLWQQKALDKPKSFRLKRDAIRRITDKLKLQRAGQPFFQRIGRHKAGSVYAGGIELGRCTELLHADGTDR